MFKKVERRSRWYERERWSYQADRQKTQAYADWLKPVEWQLFCTFTFAWKVSDAQAQKTFDAFINRLERLLKCDVSFVCGAEKRLSGCGKPACGRHFHVLMTCLAQVHLETVQELWISMAGNRSDGAGADVRSYDPNRDGAGYVLKELNKVDGDWSFRKLELFHPTVAIKTNKRSRRLLRRHRERQKHFGAGNQLHPHKENITDIEK